MHSTDYLHIDVGHTLHLLSIFQITSRSFFTHTLLNLRYWTLLLFIARFGPHVLYSLLFFVIFQQWNGYAVDAHLQLRNVIYISLLLFNFFCQGLRQCLKVLQFDRESEVIYLNMKEVVCYLLYLHATPQLACAIFESFVILQDFFTCHWLDRIFFSIVNV